MVLGVGPGDEVICPTMTFSASVNVVEHVGARPVLVDVETDTLNIDPEAVAAAVTPRTRAIMVVHYGGHAADLDALARVADAHGLHMVEDAAHAFPASHRGEVVGSTRRLTSFSFYATKNLTTGEGGMLTGDPELVDRARLLSLHGMSGHAWDRYSAKGSWQYEVVEPGFKYNMTDVQAALGLAQLGRLERMQQRRGEIAARYLEAFAADERLSLPTVRDEVQPSWHLFPIRLGAREAGSHRGRFIESMRSRNIGTSVHFIPVHLHEYYRQRYDLRPESFPVAQTAFEGLVSLPIHPGLSEEDVGDVIEAVHGALAD
jgi:dTDP-4-amino-4,6-dideoxygalactose transaminase